MHKLNQQLGLRMQIQASIKTDTPNASKLIAPGLDKEKQTVSTSEQKREQ